MTTSTDLRELVAYGPALNHHWLGSERGRCHFLRLHADFNKTLGLPFAETNCDTTAMMLRTRLCPLVDETKWVVLEANVAPNDDNYVFQISLGQEWSDVEHIVTVVGDTLLDSWFGKYQLTARSCVRVALASPTTVRQEFFTLLNIKETSQNAKMQLFYWVPSQKK